MKRILILFLILLLVFNVSALAQDTADSKNEEENIETLDLSQEKDFSDSAREELLGIASQFDSQTSIDEINIENESFNLTGNGAEENTGLKLLSDLNFDTNYNQTVVDDELKSETQLQLEYAINSRALIRAGYTLASREWWEFQNSASASQIETENLTDGTAADETAVVSSSSETVFREESESSRSIGLAYKTNDRVTVSADYIENNQLNIFSDDSDINGNTTVFGLEYDDPRGTIRASYQLDLGDELIQRITGVELDFNNLATFSASYKLLNPEDLESTLKSQTAWDLGVGVTLNENYGLNLGYEVIENQDQDEENEQNINASFEINF